MTPPSVQAQTAGPVEDSWEDKTPVGVIKTTEQTLHAIHERSKDTNASVAATLRTATSTFDRVDDVRKELKGDILDVDKKVDVLTGAFNDLRVDVKGVVVGFESLAKSYDEDRKTKLVTHMTMVTADAEVAKESKLADIEVTKTSKLADVEVTKVERLGTVTEKAKWNDTWRATMVKIVAGIGAVITAYMAGRC